MIRLILLVCVAMTVALPARAQGAQDTIRWVYTSLEGLGPAESKGLAYLMSPAQRGQYFSQRMVDFFDANDSYGADLMTACIDFALDIPGQDFDAREIARTLTVSAQGDAQALSVTASFQNFGQVAQVVYDFIAEDGFWKIDDISGPGYRVSRISCEPRGVAGQSADAVEAEAEELPAYTGGAVSYCYQQGYGTFRVDVAPDGNAQFRLNSVQANGHSCSARGSAQRRVDGWVYEEMLVSGRCRIEILVTAEQGLRLRDEDWNCKPTLCGQRAVIDGLTFTRDDQINCALMPPE